jgi:hypothetical protein
VTAPTNRPTQRREFLGQFAASAVVLASAACTTSAPLSQATAPTPAAPPPPGPSSTTTHWDDSWFARLTAKHKAVFDSPSIDDGAAIWHASGYITAVRSALAAGVDDVQTVLVMRHAAIPMVLNDAMWAKYAIGKGQKIKDYSLDKWAVRNPFFAAAPPAGTGAKPAPSSDRPQSTLQWLGSHGHILLGCDLATRGFAGELAEKTKLDQRTIYEELKANLVPGVILQPTGVYAVLRAQEAGCTFFRST